MIPIKHFNDKKPFLTKQASQMKKDAEIIKNFNMPVVALLATTPRRKKNRRK